MSQRRKFEAPFKAKVALEALRDQCALTEIASKYGVTQNQVSVWKKEALTGLSDIFRDKRRKENKEKAEESVTSNLYEEIGRLKIERDWLKKKSMELVIHSKRNHL